MFDLTIRKIILGISNNSVVKELITKNGIQNDAGFVSRFIAGESLEKGIENALRLNKDGIPTSVTALGENVISERDSIGNTETVIHILNKIHTGNVDSHVSIKLTQLGLDIDRDLCRDNMRKVLETASEYGIFIRLDMEGSKYTQLTLDLLCDLHKNVSSEIGTAVQSYLYRTESDIRNLNKKGIKIRLVKGAYLEPEKISFRKKRFTDENYVNCMKLLLKEGNNPAIATHDEKMLSISKGFIKDFGLKTDDYEYQMMYGVRRDLQKQIAEQGDNIRVTIPYGKDWYPYFTRRLGERPANVLFVIKNLYSENRNKGDI